MLVGQLYAPFDIWLYALYVLIYTAAVFMVGIYAGQRSERAWTLRREALSMASQKDISDSREVVNIADDLEDGVKKEFEWHMEDWERRVGAYRRIKWDGSAIQENLHRVLLGGKPKHLDQPKIPLLLPGGIALAGQ